MPGCIGFARVPSGEAAGDRKILNASQVPLPSTPVAREWGEGFPGV
jgi:hypothetical protein